MRLNFPHRNTWLHHVNPSLKLMIMVGIFVGIILIHNPNILLLITVSLVLVLTVWSGHPWKRLLLYTSPFLLIFISTSTGMMFFGRGETTWFRWGLIHITEESFYRGIHLGLRALCMAASGLLFSLTTKPAELFYSLMQQMRLPHKYAYSFLAGLRMVPIVFEEFMIRRQALRIRGGPYKKGIARLYDSIHRYAIPLLAQSIRRAQRISVAMQAKRFLPGRKRTYYYKIGLGKEDAYMVLMFIIIFALSFAIGLAYPYMDSTDVR